MSDDRDALAAIERAANELIPRLRERLARHGLGEIEVSHGELRVRVAAAATTGPSDPAAAVSGASAPAQAADPPSPVTSAASSQHGVSSPAVGFFVYADGLGPGLAVEKGDAVGYVEMLGIRHDVRAPRRGTVRNLVAESGEPVEYGQVVVEIEPVEAAS